MTTATSVYCNDVVCLAVIVVRGLGAGSAPGSPETSLLELQSRRVFPIQFKNQLYNQYFYYEDINDEYIHNECFIDIDKYYFYNDKSLSNRKFIKCAKNNKAAPSSSSLQPQERRSTSPSRKSKPVEFSTDNPAPDDKNSHWKTSTKVENPNKDNRGLSYRDQAY